MENKIGKAPIIEKIQKHEIQVCVLGLGYIGLPTASMFATHGVSVLGVDVKQEVIDVLGEGNIHIEEPGLKTIVKSALGSGNLQVSTSPGPSDVYIIAVPTPISPAKKADLSFVESAARSIVPHLKKGNLVILEATSPPRTTVDLVRPILEEGGLSAGEDFLLAYSPERVLPGRILYELVHNSRVIGGINPQSAQAGKALYEIFVESEIICTDATTAEVVKLLENTYRDINIAAANEFSRLAEKFQINIWEAIKIANHHPRVEILNPGPGVGGHCISVDPWFFVEKAPQEAALIKKARMINDDQPKLVLRLLEEEFTDLKGIKLAVLGLTYKPDVDDLRESPALQVVDLLIAAGSEVKAFDPYLTKGDSQLESLVDSLEEVFSDVEGIVLLVNHTQFKSLQPGEVSPLVGNKYILDTRNSIDRELWKSNGFVVKVLGDGRQGN